MRLLLCITTLLITALAGYLHSGGLHDVIAWDEANYALAANEGVLANATQLGELSKLRHRHAPLTTYAIDASTTVFGHEEWAIRLPAVIISALSCGLLVLIGFDLSRGHRSEIRLAVGAVAGLMLATSPASIELAGVIQPHSFVIFFLLLNLWTLCRYLRDLKRRDALLFGLSLSGQFVAMEYGPVVLCFSLISVAIARPSLLFGERAGDGPARFTSFIRAIIRLPRTMHRDILHAGIVCLIATALLWPAGVFLLGIPFNFVFFLLYAANGHPVLFHGEITLHVPKYAYAYWYWESYPLLLIAMLAAIVLTLIWAYRSRGPVAMTLAVFTLGLTLSVHAAHIMQLSKSIFMIPAIALGGPLAAAWFFRPPLPLGEGWCDGRKPVASGSTLDARIHPAHSTPALTLTISQGERGPERQSAIATFALAALLLFATLGGQLAPMSREKDANQRLVDMCQTIARDARPGDDVLAHGWPMVQYLLHMKHHRPDLRVHRYDPRNYELDHLGPRLARNEFEWAVTIGPSAAAHPDCPVLTELRTHWAIIADLSLPRREYRLYHAPRVDTLAQPRLAEHETRGER